MILTSAWLMRLYHRSQSSRTPIILPETTTAMGILAVIYGRESAAAFASFSTDFGVRAMGIDMIMGGLLISWSYWRYDAFKETLGLTMAALGVAIYSISVFISLGVSGLITGTGFAGLSLVFLSRIYFIVLSYRSRKQIEDVS
jgi:hypothetical protein